MYFLKSVDLHFRKWRGGGERGRGVGVGGGGPKEGGGRVEGGSGEGGRNNRKVGGGRIFFCILMRENPINFCSFSNKLKDNIEKGGTSFN